MDAAVSALKTSGKIEVATIETAIAVHMQLKSLPFMRVLAQFVPAQLAGLDGEVRAMANVIKWDKRKVILDGSAQLANGIFTRLEREFDAGIDYVQIAKQLQADEESLFALLDVKEEQQ